MFRLHSRIRRILGIDLGQFLMFLGGDIQARGLFSVIFGDLPMLSGLFRRLEQGLEFLFSDNRIRV